ncbi:MAG: LysR family transcriptional regulator [Bdellovibrionaceae bacterium]|jgi:LysR family transcriptional regulator, regulator for bpeEF and oprC|nr:LysR family transcriptional regulator [Pseudobdellovibrionaceae bacterium]
MDYNLLKTFSKVAELGSFTQAAKVLNHPKSRVSRAISRLENELDVQLIRRTTRKTTLTSSGQEFFHNIHPLLNSINNEITKVSNQQHEMSGTIRITTSQDIGQALVSKVISLYNSKYPNVQFDTIITNDFLDLVKENIDIAIRAGKLKDSTLIQKKFISTHFIIVCSKKYLENFGSPTTLEDLKNHKFLSFKGLEREFFNKSIRITPVVTTDSIPMLLNMILNNDGIGILPSFFCKEHLEDKTLVQIIPTWKSKTGHLRILYPPNKNIPHKVKAFIDIATSIFNNN